MIDSKYIKILKSVNIFKDFSEESLSSFLEHSGATTQLIKKKQTIFMEGDIYNNICIILDGEVILSKYDESGNRNIIDILQKGKIFAEVFSLTENKISPVTATVTCDTRILTIDTKNLLSIGKNSDIEILQEKYNLISRMLSIFAEKNMILLSKINLLSKRNTRDKIIHFLKTFALKTDSKVFKIPFSRNEMADFLGVDRSSLSRELGNLKEEHIIDFNKNMFTLLSDDYFSDNF
ncbi:Crp/Fnr family transcriptional regulator [Peptostreptococcus faecalis]|uniref:Crp/Fnr family transcriptional regulator n=1 Tax=Peptostreptococcus faecalis TaxID=2045015 RepID=UPI001FA84376|nr:Crp/Fnr family transcriptional regulator [Peptostreptococcus faecalis]